MPLADKDYSIEMNIANSILIYCKDNIFNSWTFTGNNKQFFDRYPTGQFKRPCIVCEYRSGKRVSGEKRPIGKIYKNREFIITILGETSDSTFNKEWLLMQYKNMVEDLIDGITIDYRRFDYNNLDPPSIGQFNVEYISDSIESERIQKDRNVAEIVLRIK